MKKAMVIILLFTCVVSAREGTATEWTDETHGYLSHKLSSFAHRLDNKLMSICAYFCDNNDTKSVASTTTEPRDVSGWVMELFEEGVTDPVYIQSSARVRTTLLYDHQTGAFGNAVSFSLSLALPKFTERINLIIENIAESTDNRNFNDDIKNSIGLYYRMPTEQFFNSTLFVGMHGLNDPYVKAHLWIPFELGVWQNILYEDIKYSRLNEYEETTGLLFDRIIDDKTLFRLQLGRRNAQYIEETTQKGDFYFAAISLSQILSDSSAYKVGISTLGRYQLEPEVNKYALYGIYKQKIWREWLFFEVEPRVEWDKLYDFHPNYLLLFSLELYIGKGFTQEVFSGFRR